MASLYGKSSRPPTPRTPHTEGNYANLPRMNSSSEDEEDEHFVLPNQFRLRNNYNERKYKQLLLSILYVQLRQKLKQFAVRTKQQ